jgi:hypothetical protein
MNLTNQMKPDEPVEPGLPDPCDSVVHGRVSSE